MIWNGDNKIGLLYVGTNKKIHISGDTVVGSSFDILPSSDPVVGVERGCVLSYFVWIISMSWGWAMELISNERQTMILFNKYLIILYNECEKVR